MRRTLVWVSGVVNIASRSGDCLVLLDERGDKVFEERDKTVLITKGQNHFDILPEGWIQVTHNSGMPLYLHKSSRVCTLARPYFLGPGSVRVLEILTVL